ncbi:MAG: ATPase domain-containing protein [Candidatus Aenigmatarchaeota archaeon]
MAVQNERIKTGVEGLDELISGGLPEGSLTLLTGTCGTGKTLISSQFIYYGAVSGENAVYVSFEETPENIKSNAKLFGWNFDELEKKGKVLFVKYDPYHAEDIIEMLENSIRKINAKRVVIDSISALGLYVRDIPEIRKIIFGLSTMLHRLGCTTLMISEVLAEQKDLSRFSVEEFVADGVIVLYYLRTNSQFSRSLTVWKLRGSDHSQKLHPYKITHKGIVVYPKEEAYAGEM